MSCGWLGSYTKMHLANHLGLMVVANLAVNFEQQRAVVFMPEPVGDRPDIDARFQACRPEKMPESMGREPGDTHFLAGAVDEALRLFDQQHRAGRSCIVSLRFHPGNKLAHLGGHRDRSLFPVLRHTQADGAAHGVHIGPMHMCGLILTGTAERHELHVIGRRPTVSHPGFTDGFDQP